MGSVYGAAKNYDPLSRLVEVDDANGHALQSYTYNPTGDRLSKTGNGLATGTYSYTVGTHRLSGIGNGARTSDANGNMTGNSSAGQVWGYGYNGRNRMVIVQANGNTVGTYVYNALGQRISKVAALPTAISERFAYDEQGNLIGEYGTTNRDYVWMNGIPVAVIDTVNSASSTLNYVTADALGTPRVVSDSQGHTIWSWAWLNNPFGEQAPVSTSGYVLNLRFPGQYYDAESGLVHNGYRDDCPECGRYIQSDPTGLDGGISTYAYAGQDPLDYVDPLGEKDFLAQCVGRYTSCAYSQNPNGSTIKNYLMFKGCKAALGWGVKESENAGTAVACEADFHECSGGLKPGEPSDNPQVLKCYQKYEKCVSGG